MVHIFSIRYPDTVDYFRMVIEGDLEKARTLLQSYSEDVKYINSRERKKSEKGQRSLLPGLIVRACGWTHTMKPKWTKPPLQQNTLPIDPRHKVLKEGSYE